MLTKDALLRMVKSQIREVTVEDVYRRVVADPNGNGHRPVLIDVREQDEVDQGFIAGALHIARGNLELRIEERVPDRTREVILYCARGNRSALAAKALGEMGYGRVASMAGGFGEWKRANKPFVVEQKLTAEQRQRYSRHLLLPEVGEVGQKKLLAAKVLCVGAGGLGSPAALYLAAAGVGTLGIVDDDVLDRSNLQRQILHRDADVGKPKVDSAERTLNALNPDVRVVKYQERLTSDNILRILDGYDVVVDGSDNFPTRYLINDACVFKGIPNVHGSIFRFDGQTTVFHPGKGPCYRCIFPEPPPAGLAPSCDEAGVIGALPGVVGVIQAIETLKLILGAGDVLRGRLLMFDALTMTFREVKLRRDPRCPVCGEQPTIRELIDYEQFCSVGA